jgi:hypothetical protein
VRTFNRVKHSIHAVKKGQFENRYKLQTFKLIVAKQAMYVQHKTEARPRNHCCRVKAISITYLCLCVCVSARARAWPVACACACVHVVLLIQHTTPMRHIVTSFVAPLIPPYFSTLSHKRHDFRGGGGGKFI